MRLSKRKVTAFTLGPRGRVTAAAAGNPWEEERGGEGKGKYPIFTAGGGHTLQDPSAGSLSLLSHRALAPLVWMELRVGVRRRKNKGKKGNRMPNGSFTMTTTQRERKGNRQRRKIRSLSSRTARGTEHTWWCAGGSRVLPTKSVNEEEEKRSKRKKEKQKQKKTASKEKGCVRYTKDGRELYNYRNGRAHPSQRMWSE